VLIVDDIGVAKDMRDAYTYYDHASGEFKWGFIPVTLGIVTTKLPIPWPWSSTFRGVSVAV
jgi:hypothetical protein